MTCDRTVRVAHFSRFALLNPPALDGNMTIIYFKVRPSPHQVKINGIFSKTP